MENIIIKDKVIGEKHPSFIIAELGINHQGEIAIARELIQQAKISGADAVKFQKRSISRILTKEGLEMPYDNPNSFGKTYGEHKKVLELSEYDYNEDLSEFYTSKIDKGVQDLLDEYGIEYDGENYIINFNQYKYGSEKHFTYKLFFHKTFSQHRKGITSCQEGLDHL